MPKPHGERKFSPEGGTPHGGALGGQRDSETRLRSADVLNEELLMRREPFRVERWHILLEPPVVIWRAGTRMGEPSDAAVHGPVNAPPPRLAHHLRSCAGLDARPRTISPRRSSAINVPHVG